MQLMRRTSSDSTRSVLPLATMVPKRRASTASLPLYEDSDEHHSNDHNVSLYEMSMAAHPVVASAEHDYDSAPSSNNSSENGDAASEQSLTPGRAASHRSQTWRMGPPRRSDLHGDHILPTWQSNPQSADGTDNTGSNHNHLNYSTHQSHKARVPLFMIGFVLVGLAAVATSRKTVNTAAGQVAQLNKNREKMDLQLKKAQREMQVLKREIMAMDAMISQQQQHGNRNTHAANSQTQRALTEMTLLQERLKSEAQQAEVLKTRVQKTSRQAVLDKYGPGPYRVQVDLVFPDKKLGPSKFVIELASVDAMPHSVHTFLEMVSHGLLDGCSFILNALHVVKAAPLPYDGTSAAEKARLFAAHGLESVAFREYNEQYLHKQYTVGFAADGSPSFYINTEDNTEIHVGDPCFGKVVEGYDAVRRLEAAPTRNGIWFEKRIGIKTAKILS